MKKIITLLFTAFIVLPLFSQEKRYKVKTMTYNIYSARNQGLQAIAEVIKCNNPDLVSLQEVERFTEINPGDVPAQLSEMTGLQYYYFVHALDIKKGGDYGNVILSRYPIVESHTYPLGTFGKDYMRSFGYVKVKIEDREIYFASTHLDHKSNDSLRIAQVKQIFESLKDIGDKPLIMGGDMNSCPTGAAVIELAKEFTLPQHFEVTAPVPNADKTIDYLMYRPYEVIKPISYFVDTDAGEASDHYPVIGIFQIK